MANNNNDNNIITITANFQISSVYLYIDIQSDYGYTQPAGDEMHYFDIRDNKVVNVYPYPTIIPHEDSEVEGIPPIEVFDRWEAKEGSLQDNHPKETPLTLTMDKNREIIAHFRRTTEEDGGAAVISHLRDNMQWYYSIHDGYYYMDRTRRDSDNDA